jgi:uncharacterized protein YbaP (TraB family)
MRKLLLLLTLALAACNQPAPAPTAQHADPALWVVKDADTTIYLFGTIHLLKPGLGWFGAEVKTAFDQSGELVLELVAPPQPEMAALFEELGLAQSGPPLPAQLPPETREKLAAALAKLGMPANALDRAEPWYAAITLSVLPIRDLGYDPALGAEQVLTEAAKKQGKPLVGLESPREQLSYFDRLSPDAQRKLLEETLDGMPRAGAVLEAAIAAWSKGDADGLAKLVNEDLKDSPELNQSLLVTRNRHWSEWIAKRMGRPGTAFVAVGAGHLAGAEGLQAMLAARGLKVARVTH